MPVLAWANSHRLLTLSVGVSVVVVAIVAGFWFFVFRDSETQIDLSQALRIYRHGQAHGSLTREPQLPPAGVYTYRTTGGEQLSLAGLSRDFPPITSMIVTDVTCSTMMWEPYVQHVEGLVECRLPDSALGIGSLPSSEEIAGIRTSSDIRCPPNTYFVPPDPQPGENWHTTFHAEGETVTLSGQVIGSSSVMVSGRDVPAVQTKLDFTYSGNESGENPNEYSILMPDGIILRQHESVALTQQTGPLGSVHYSENLGITLTSLRPAR
ncbi:MAG: hypothetical protein ACLQPH_08565 [Acidimicrobiales bacterium]